MSILESVVVVTSAALIASGALTASSAPAPAAGRTTQLHAAAPEQLNPGLLATITKSMTATQLSPVKTTEALEKQLATVRAALQDAEAATLEATENAVAAEEAATQDRTTAASLAGTSLATLGRSQALVQQLESARLAHTAQRLFDQAELRLNAKHEDLVEASEALHKTSVARESARLARVSESREEAELIAALEDSESDVAEPVNDPALDPETLESTQVAVGALGTASVATAAIQVPTKKMTRTARIKKSVEWAKKIAKNNKYKYRYGATGPRYFDCSGYVGKAFAKGGKKLKRTSSAQYKAAPKKVKLSKLKKGDLVFWSSNRGRSFYHVAMYVGNGKIAHAHNPKAGISVTRLNYAGMRNIYKYAGRY